MFLKIAVNAFKTLYGQIAGEGIWTLTPLFEQRIN